jgi:hypothetical protein
MEEYDKVCSRKITRLQPTCGCLKKVMICWDYACEKENMIVHVE